MSRQNKRLVKAVLLNLVFVLLCLVALVPILYALSVSFSGKGAALSGSLSFWPKDPTLENYRAILFDEPLPAVDEELAAAQRRDHFCGHALCYPRRLRRVPLAL